MKYKLLAVIIILSEMAIAQDFIAIGDPAPSFALPDSNGQIQGLENYSGEIILLNFFATWCGPCKIEAPLLEDSVWNVYRNEGVTVLALDVMEPLHVLSPFVNIYGITYPILRDTSGSVFQQYGFRILPSSVIINREGLVVHVEEGFNIDIFQKVIDSLLHVTAIKAPASPLVPDRPILVSAYPNPFNSTITVEIFVEERTRYRLRIYNVLGKPVFKRENNSTPNGTHIRERFNFSELVSGIYFLEVQAGAQVEMHRLVYIK